MRRLFHFTCRDSVGAIREERQLRPRSQPVLGGAELVWLTDLDDPTREQVGLTSHVLSCDRMEYRVEARAPYAVRWTTYARHLPVEQRRELELSPGAMPAHWWVSTEPVMVVAVEPGEMDA